MGEENEKANEKEKDTDKSCGYVHGYAAVRDADMAITAGQLLSYLKH